MSQPPSNAWSSPSTVRNREPILGVLRPRLVEKGVVLEVAAGSGEHAIFLAAALPHLQWQPTDADEGALASISAWRDHAGTPNLRPPLRLDAGDPEHWPVASAEAVVSINMIHISPWSATLGLLAGAGRVLSAGGTLFTYGPYLQVGVETAPSNLAFDASLRSRNPDWGIRQVEAVAEAAVDQGLTLEETIAMPANNLMLVFRKRN